MEKILKHFPDLTPDQVDKFKKLEALYEEWNEKINVISRKDLDAFYERHVLHSLGIVKMMKFQKGTKILDVGTGGGFPGIPLAIMYPDCEFVLVDSIAKKIKVVQAVIDELQLKNIKAVAGRAEEVKDKFDFVVSRAVTRMNKFIPWIQNKFRKDDKNFFPNGILYLKGGDLAEELGEISQDYDIFDLSSVFEGEFFETKKVVYVRMV